MSSAIASIQPLLNPPAPPSVLTRTTCVGPGQMVQVPGWVRDLDSFRRWALSDQFPEKVRILYLRDEIWMDLSMEQAFSHNAIKSAATTTLNPLANQDDFGLYFTDGMRLIHVPANLSGEPDGMFVASSTLASGRVRLIAGKEEGFVEVEGSPDMVLEIISTSSVEKDTATLRDLYWQASISEYWLIDARQDFVVFDILRHAGKGYIATRKRDGWIKSSVFGKSFQLARTIGKHGHPKFTLLVK